MSGLGLSWDVRGSYATPCACQGEAAANPALDAGALLDIFDELGEAVAVGELGRRAGYPLGDELVTRALELASELAGETETGSIVSSAGARLARGAAAVEAPAQRAWAKMRANPELVSRLGNVSLKAGVALGAYLLASKWLNPDEAAKAEHVAGLRAMMGEALQDLTPAERVKFLAGNLSELVGGGGGGLSFGSWAGLALLVVGGLVAWRWTR